MTAAQYEAIAEDAVRSFTLYAAPYEPLHGKRLTVHEDGSMTTSEPENCGVMQVTLAPENTASAAALKNALLMSLRGCENCTDEDEESNGHVTFSLNNEHGETESVPCTCLKGQALYLSALSKVGVA
jgi:hypothetical protein